MKVAVIDYGSGNLASAARALAVAAERNAIRADGRHMIPSYLFEVKSPAESRAPWDYMKVLQTTPADEAWRPLSEGACPLVRS